MKYTVRFILSMLLLTAAVPSKAKVISVEEARQTAAQFLLPAQKAATRSGETKSDVITLSKNGEAALYVFNRSQGGYVIVSADDATTRQILGWSDSGCYDPGVPSALKDVLENYADGIARMRSTGKALSTGTSADGYPESVDPLLGDIEWGQDSPYNRMTPTGVSPYYEDPVHCPTGCVSTAVAQVMMYHRWPEHGYGSNSITYNGQTISADFSQSTYRWDLMLPNYRKVESYTDEQADAVALLMHDVGIAMRTSYTLVESSAGIQGYELSDFFDYDRSVRKANGNFCSTEDWEGILRSEISAGRPVLVSGGSQVGGHEYVCDGYDAEGLFHYNFGWDGTNNGWFVSTATGFDASPWLLYGIQKNCGGTAALSLHSETNFKWEEDNKLTGELALECAGLHIYDDIELELALALENTADGTVTYFVTNTTNYYSNSWNVFYLNESVPDGSYKVYPVGRIVGQEWQTFLHNPLHQIVIDLTVENGVKTWANNNLVDPIENGAVEIDRCYYLLDEESGEATMTFRNGKYNSYSGDVTVPETVTYGGRTYMVTSIGERAFQDCQELKSVSVGANVITIAFGAFGYDHNLTSISFAEGSNLQAVAGWAFNGCYSLKNIVLPNGTGQLNMCAFQGCGLESVTIPESVYYIATSCFTGCSDLKDIYLSWTSPDRVMCNDDFLDDGLPVENITVHVPEGYVDIYRAIAPWNYCKIVDSDEEPEEKCIYVVWGMDGVMNTAQAQATLKQDIDGCYSGDITFPDNTWDGACQAYFCLVLSDSYSVFKENCLGAPTFGYRVADGVTCGFSKGSDNSFEIPAGTHHIVINMETFTISFGPVSGVKDISKTDDAVMYDLTGRIVTNPVPGQLLIRNGRKYLYK